MCVDFHKCDIYAAPTRSLPSPSPATAVIKGDFVPMEGMLDNLRELINVKDAEDRTRILGEIEAEMDLEAINRLARGTIVGAKSCMPMHAV